MASIPTVVLWMLLAAWASAAFLACLTAALLAPHVRWIAWAAAMLPLLGAMSNFVTLPHPLWMEAVGITSPIVSAALVQRWQRKRG